eukprot:UC4_evm2s871
MTHGGGKCRAIDGKATCVDCPPGYGGPDCASDTDECAPTESEPYGPCGGREGEQKESRGLCSQTIGAKNDWEYQCSCAPGFQEDKKKKSRNGKRIEEDGIWANCDIDIDECRSNPCQNNGLCVDKSGSFYCECLKGYNGTMCEVDVQLCENVRFAVELLQLNHSAYCKYNCADFAPDDFICTCGDNSTVALEFMAPIGFIQSGINTENRTLKRSIIEEIAGQLGLSPEDIEDIDFE